MRKRNKNNVHEASNPGFSGNNLTKCPDQYSKTQISAVCPPQANMKTIVMSDNKVMKHNNHSLNNITLFSLYNSTIHTSILRFIYIDG